MIFVLARKLLIYESEDNDVEGKPTVADSAVCGLLRNRMASQHHAIDKENLNHDFKQGKRFTHFSYR